MRRSGWQKRLRGSFRIQAKSDAFFSAKVGLLGCNFILAVLVVLIYAAYLINDSLIDMSCGINPQNVIFVFFGRRDKLIDSVLIISHSAARYLNIWLILFGRTSKSASFPVTSPHKLVTLLYFCLAIKLVKKGTGLLHHQVVLVVNP